MNLETIRTHCTAGEIARRRQGRNHSQLLKFVLAMVAGAGLAFPLGAPAAELLYVPDSTARIGQLTGDSDRAAAVPTLSRTGERFGVTATDLGSSFEHKGKLYFLFGDTFSRPGEKDRDVLAWTDSTDPARLFLEFHRAEDGRWLPLTVPGIKQGGFEVPSYGISIGDTIYVVHTTDHSKEKTMGRSVLASSHDDGRTFKLLYELSRSRFINVAFWRTDDWLYIYGSGLYRKSSVSLARVKPVDFEDRTKLEYFIGMDAQGRPRWSAIEADAADLFRHDQVGELSVACLKPVNRYVMLYNAEQPRGINLRSAETPWGPWSGSAVIFDPERDQAYGKFMHRGSKGGKKTDALSDPGNEEVSGDPYGPYIMSRFTSGADGNCRIYYTMSAWNPYQVMIMRSDLKLGAAP